MGLVLHHLHGMPRFSGNAHVGLDVHRETHGSPELLTCHGGCTVRRNVLGEFATECACDTSDYYYQRIPVFILELILPAIGPRDWV